MVEVGGCGKGGRGRDGTWDRGREEAEKERRGEEKKTEKRGECYGEVKFAKQEVGIISREDDI
jgi:hypothetical protein